MIRVVAEAGSKSLWAELREVARALLERWHCGECSFALAIAEPFIETEDEASVFSNRSTDGGTKLILLERLFRLSEIVVGIDCIVAQKLPQCPVHMVRSRSRDEVRCRSQSVSKFCIGVMCNDAELADRIHRRLEHESTVDPVKVIRSINEKTIRLRSLAVDRITLPVAQRSASFGDAGSQGNHSRLQQAELREVAPIEGQVLQLLLLYDFAHTCNGGLDQLCIGAYQHLLLFQSNGKMRRD